MKHVLMMATLALSVLMVTSGVMAQDDSGIELGAYTFADGTTIRYPAEYIASPIGDGTTRLQLEVEDRGFFYITLYTADDVALFGYESVRDAMVASYVPVDENYVLPIDDAVVLDGGVAPITFLRYDDNNLPGTFQGVELPSGGILIIDAFGAFYNSEYERVGLAMMDDVANGNTNFALDTFLLPTLPFAPRPVDAPSLQTYAFSSGATMRLSSEWIVADDFDRRDFVQVTLPGADFYIDYFTADDIAGGDLETVVDVMSISYIPLNDDSPSFKADEVSVVTYGDIEVYFWRYDDQGLSGTLVAVMGDIGDVLILDAFRAHPGSLDEDYAVAVALDFAGDATLLEGRELTPTNTTIPTDAGTKDRSEFDDGISSGLTPENAD